MKYNVGICLYGLPREIEICQKFNATFFEKLNIQPYYFCHTWLTTDYKFKKTYNYSDYIENNINPVVVEQDDTVEYIEKYCNQKNIELDSNTRRNITHAGCREIGQFLSLERSVQILKENKNKVPDLDLIIIKRYDVVFNYSEKHNNLSQQIAELIENKKDPIVYQPIIDGTVVEGYPQASCYYFLTNEYGAQVFSEDFGYNIILLRKKLSNITDFKNVDNYLYDQNWNSVRNKHVFWLQQYINNVHSKKITPDIKHTVVRHTCTQEDSFEEIARKFI